MLLGACGGGAARGDRGADGTRDGAAGARATSHPEPSSRLLDSLLAAAVAKSRLPGFAAVIVGPDSQLAIGAAGVRRRGRPEALTTADRFHIGSNAKALTATIIASLVGEGKLDWETRVADVLPGIADSMQPGYRDITVEHLLAHTSGVPSFTSGRDWRRIPDVGGDVRAQRRAFAEWVLARPPAGTPGEMSYSNAGYAIVAAVAEAATGRSWEALLEERVLQPLGISAGSGWPAAGGAGQPWGHWRLLGFLSAQDPDGAYRLRPAMAPAGDVHMRLDEYGRFLQAHLRGLLGREDLLPAEIVRHMHRPGAGLGWGVQLRDGEPLSGHAGSAGTFFMVAVIDPSRRLAAAVVTNAGAKPAPDAASDLLRQLMRIWSGGSPDPARER